MAHKQPAQPSYFFHGGFVDLGKVISGSFKNCGDVISRSAEGLVEAWFKIWENIGENILLAIFTNIPPTFLLSFYLIRLLSSLIVTPLICFSITVFQIAILFVFFIITLIYFLFIALLDKIFCTVRAISSHCPLCQHKFMLPIYICPNCGVEHDRLIPGYYGILSRKCNCGKVLPTTFLNGRQKLEARCPACKCNVKAGGLHSSLCIPIVGGASSGKTCYINMTMMSLEQNAFSRYGLHFEYENNGLDEYEENTIKLSQGYLPEKTQELRLRYYQFTLTHKQSIKQQISLCDVAGELFDVTVGGDAINKQTGFRYVNAFVLIIDPLSIPDYRNEVSKIININSYNSSRQNIDEMLDTFVRTLQNMFSVDSKTMLNTDVAVVFSKSDIPGLDEKIGESAVLKHAPSLTPKVRLEIQNTLCEQFLRKYNEDNFLNSLKSRFKSIQFFLCSALGHIENGQPFVASNVEKPIFWLLTKRSNVIARALK